MLKRYGWLFILMAMLLPFQNCGESMHDFEGSSDQSSLEYFSGSCEAIIMNQFNSSYYGFLRGKCAGCHSNGPGNGQFANANFATAFAAFQSLGRTRVERNILNPSHQPALTGPQNQNMVDNARPNWQIAEADYNQCVTDAGGTPVLEGVLSLHKSSAQILQVAAQNNSWVRLNWDLETEVGTVADAGKYRINVSIEVRAAALRPGSTVRPGYEFRNPSIRLKNLVSGNFRVKGIHLSINNNVLSDVTTYSMINRVASTTTDLNIAPNFSLALAVLPAGASSADSFALKFDLIQQTTDADNPNGGGGNDGGGGGIPNLPTTVTYAQLMSTDINVGVFRNSCLVCHSATVSSGGLNLANYNAARGAVSDIVGRMNNAANPMPRSGLLSPRDRELVNIWMRNGTPQ